MSIKRFEVVAKVGEYEQNGEKKARWANCGIVFENEKNGALNLKLETIPVGDLWNGWFMLKPVSNEARASASSNGSSASASASAASAPAPRPAPVAKPAPVAPAAEPATDGDNNLPF